MSDRTCDRPIFEGWRHAQLSRDLRDQPYLLTPRVPRTPHNA